MQQWDQNKSVYRSKKFVPMSYIDLILNDLLFDLNLLIFHNNQKDFTKPRFFL